MTKEELSQIIYDAWTADTEVAGILHNPDGTPVHPEMLGALTDAVAEGILQAVSTGATGNLPRWHEETFAGTGSAFTLTYTPISKSLTVYRNGLPEFGWALSGKALTLASARTAGDADLRVRYQYSPLL